MAKNIQSFRIDAGTRRLLEEFSRARGIGMSEAIRQAIEIAARPDEVISLRTLRQRIGEILPRNAA
jgi:hypothetical protein